MKFGFLLALTSSLISFSTLAFDYHNETTEINKDNLSDPSEEKLTELFKTGWARLENNNHLILGTKTPNIINSINGFKISASMSMCSIVIRSGFIMISGFSVDSGIVTNLNLKLKNKEAIIRAYQKSLL